MAIRCSSVVYAMAIILVVALMASPAQSAGRSLANEAGSANNAMAAVVVNATAAASSSDAMPSGAGDLMFCVQKSCVYPGRGSSACYCCATDKPPKCYDTKGKCNANCI